MMRLAAYIVRGPNQATLAVVLFALLSLFLPLVGLLSSSSVALVALRQGMAQSGRVVVAAAAVLCLAGMALTGALWAPLLYGALMWLPVWAVALLLRSTRQIGWALEFAALLGLLGVSAIYATVADPSAMWAERFRALLIPLAQRAGSAETGQIEQLGDWFSAYLTGIVAAGSVSSVIVSLILARWWQASLFNPGGFAHEFTQMRLHKGTHYLGLICVLLAFTGSAAASEYFWNMSIVLVVLFVVLGFSIVHRLFASKANKRFWLAGLYVLAMLVPQTLLPVALLGITDAWVNWRERLAR
jgi:hypothetical protein